MPETVTVSYEVDVPTELELLSVFFNRDDSKKDGVSVGTIARLKGVGGGFYAGSHYAHCLVEEGLAEELPAHYNRLGPFPYGITAKGETRYCELMLEVANGKA